MAGSLMPYYINENNSECSGWAVEKEDGEVLGCHNDKQSAIDQMVALSIAEGIDPAGERKIHYKKKKMKRDLPDNYRPALTEDVPEGRACGNCFFYNEEIVNEDRTMAYCEKWEEFVDGAFYCNAWQEDEESRAPAPKKEQIVGSDENEPGSAKGDGSDIVFSEATTTALKNKVSDHNEKMKELDKPDYTRTSLGTLKSVYRRGSGAYSTSFRPGVSRAAWSMARVNAFLYLLRNGRPENAKYVTDNDLLPSGHPKSSRSVNTENYEERQINLTPPAYMRAAARRGLELNRQGFGGDGLTDKTKREAREMADGQVSEDKWVRIAAWIARHMVDLDAPKNSDPNDPQYPGAGLVAHLLWGSGPSKSAARRTMNYAEGVVERIRAEENRERWRSVGVQLKEKKENKLQVESRVRNNIDFEIRLDQAQSDGMKFSGYAAVFNSNSEPLPFTERILEGAFSKTLKSRNEVKLFKNHNSDEVLASTRSKTLKLREDSTGLLAEATLPDTTAGRDLAVLMKRGDVHSMSFGFTVPEGGDSWNSKGTIREFREIRLHEVSIVTGFPAYAATTASVRTLETLSKRTLVDADKIADVLLKLESGETLPNSEANLLVEIVDKLRDQKEQVEEDITNLDLKRKELDLLFKAV